MGTCVLCASTSSNTQSEPLKMTKMPNAPWEKLHLDFKGPLPGGKYLLVVIDRYSRYPEVEIITSTNAKTVIRKLNKIFSAHGIPEIILTDNGPPFHSKEFKMYLEQNNVSHQFSTPYWPQGNAEAERFMRTLGKVLTIGKLMHTDLETALHQYLFQYRITPHSTTKVPPAELIFNRKIRSKIPDEKRGSVDKHAVAARHEEDSRKYNKKYADCNRNTRKSNLTVGETVLIKMKKTVDTEF